MSIHYGDGARRESRRGGLVPFVLAILAVAALFLLAPETTRSLGKAVTSLIQLPMR